MASSGSRSLLCLDLWISGSMSKLLSAGLSMSLLMMFIELLPKVSETTWPSWMFDTVRRFFSLDIKLVSLNRDRIRSRSCLVARGGIKLPAMRSCLNKSAIHFMSLWSVFLPRIALTYLGWANVMLQEFSSTTCSCVTLICATFHYVLCLSEAKGMVIDMKELSKD